MDPNYGYVQQTTSNRSPFLQKNMMLLVGGLVVAVIVAIVLLLSSSQGGLGKQVQHLLLRIENLQSIVDDQKVTRNLKNQQLSNLVAGLTLTLTSDSQSLKQTLGASVPEKFDEAIVVSETDTTSSKTIEDAYLENKLDRTYKDVLSKKIADLRALIAETYAISKNGDLNRSLEEIDGHLSTAYKQLESITTL